MDEITIIGETDWRNTNKIFGIKDQDRLNHIYCIGKTGVGKSNLLLSMAISDIQRGNGVGLIDPHGDISETIINYIPEARIKDVIYFNAADANYPISFNPLHGINPINYNLVCAGLISTFKKIWADSWGPRLEHILRFSILTLLHYPHATLLDIHLLLTDPLFRLRVLNYLTDDSLRSFWSNEFDKYTPQFRNEAIAPILNKVGLFIASRTIRNITGQEQSSVQIQDILDNKKILICSLPKGLIGEDASALLGAMILTTIQSAALFRASYDERKRMPFYLYVDEMQTFLTLSFADILSECRKYGIGLFLANQYIKQLDEQVAAAIFGNIGTLISFRVGAEDAKTLENEFYPVFKETDLINLPRYSIYLKLMIDGSTSKPFSATTLLISESQHNHRKEIIEYSRRMYACHIDKAAIEISSRNKKSHAERTLF